LGPIPNPQSPIPNPQSPIPILIQRKLKNKNINNKNNNLKLIINNLIKLN